MSRAFHSTPTDATIARTRLLEVQYTIATTLSTGMLAGDPASVTRAVEAFLDHLAYCVNPDALHCQDCGEPLADYRVRRWYHAEPNAQVFDILCRSCEATREDKEADARAFVTYARA